MAGILSHADFLKATRDVRMVPKETLLNETTKNTYFFFSKMMKGAEDSFRGGTKLVDKIQGSAAGTFSFYNPNDEFSPSQNDTLVPIEVNWAFGESHYVIIRETAALNSGDPNAYLDYVKSLEQACVVDTVNGMEEALWAGPNPDTMESSTATTREAYSIPCFVTRDGLEPSGSIDNATDPWSTIETVDPSNDTWFKNKFGTYTASDPTHAVTGLIPAFDDIVLQTQFETPDPLTKYSESESAQKNVIVTNRDGIVAYKKALRAVNDRMDSLQDPQIRGPQYEGVPLKYVAECDNLGWTDDKPDYLFLNLNYLKPFFHTGMYMDEVITDGGSKQPNSTVVYKFTWYNLLCRSRRRQGRIYSSD